MPTQCEICQYQGYNPYDDDDVCDIAEVMDITIEDEPRLGSPRCPFFEEALHD